MPQRKETDIFIGKRLREIRLERKFSQKKIGQILGVSFQQVHKYETADNRLSCASAIILSNTLGFDVRELLPTPSRRKKTKKISVHEAPIEVCLHYGRLL